MNNPTNRSNPCDSPRTDLLHGKRCKSPSKKDRTHDLSMVDPHVRCGRSGRAPPSRAWCLRSREEGGAALRGMVEIRSKREERGAALRNNSVSSWGVPPPLFIVGREGAPSWGGGQPLVRPHLGFPLPMSGHKGEEASSPRRKLPPRWHSLLGLLGPSAPSPLGPSK